MKGKFGKSALIVLAGGGGWALVLALFVATLTAMDAAVDLWPLLACFGLFLAWLVVDTWLAWRSKKGD